jgi:hypothetical protein
MLAYINAYSVTALLPWELEAIKGLGFDGIRFDVTPTTNVRASCDILEKAGLRAIMLVNGGDMPLSYDATVGLAQSTSVAASRSFLPWEAMAIEVGNEPDIAPLYKLKPSVFGFMVDFVAGPGVAEAITVVSGGVFSTGEDGINYLGLAARQMRKGIKLGVHSYRQAQGPLGAQRPYRSRADEFRAIKAAANGLDVWCTETGWHTAKFPLRFCLKKQWNDQNVLGFLRDELALQAAAGTQVTSVYQWTDGPTDQGIDRFGLRRVDGSLKPQAKCLEGAEWRTR